VRAAKADAAGTRAAYREAVQWYERLSAEYGPPTADPEVLARLRSKAAG
jgi:hypothetical protein